MAFLEWGPSDAPVVLLCHPSTRVAPGWDVAEAAGVRIVFPDRPGFGASSFKRLSILDWTADVAALIERLDVGRFFVAGVSAATAYALACGVTLVEQVIAIGIIAGSVPHTGQTELAALARNDPDAAFAAIRSERARALDHEADAQRTRTRPEPDGSFYAQPEIQSALVAASKETYRQGVDGPSWDAVLRMRPWGFSPSDVASLCRWWHGAVDSVVPPKAIEEATSGLTQHTVRLLPDVGHGACISHVEPFLRELIADADTSNDF